MTAERRAVKRTAPEPAGALASGRGDDGFVEFPLAASLPSFCHCDDWSLEMPFVFQDRRADLSDFLSPPRLTVCAPAVARLLRSARSLIFAGPLTLGVGVERLSRVMLERDRFIANTFHDGRRQGTLHPAPFEAERPQRRGRQRPIALGRLFPECLEDWIDENNSVRVIDIFVDELDLGELGFDGVAPEVTGRPAYHPLVLLKLYMYGYLNRVQSSRRLEREAGRNVEVCG